MESNAADPVVPDQAIFASVHLPRERVWGELEKLLLLPQQPSIPE